MWLMKFLEVDSINLKSSDLEKNRAVQGGW